LRVAAWQGDGKKKKAKFDKDYVLRFNALYFTPLTDAMVAYAERDANGSKAAGGAGLPKFIQKTSAPASDSALYQASSAKLVSVFSLVSVLAWCNARGAIGPASTEGRQAWQQQQSESSLLAAYDASRLAILAVCGHAA
jgi:hypothetical protein